MIKPFLFWLTVTGGLVTAVIIGIVVYATFRYFWEG